MSGKITPEQCLSNSRIEYRQHGSNLYFDCPGCGEGMKTGSASMHAETGVWTCSRTTCPGIGEAYLRSGTMTQFRVAVGEIQPYERRDTEAERRGITSAVKKEYSKPKPIVRAEPSYRKLAAEMILGRGITPEVGRSFGLTPVERNDNPGVAFPYIRNGKHVATKYRWRDGDKTAWKNFDQDKDCKQVLYGADLISDKATTLVITEGEFDAMASWVFGVPAVSLPGGISSVDSWMPHEYEWLEQFDTIHLAVDMDASQKDLDKLADRLGRHRTRRVVMPWKDLNECLLQGWTADEYTQALRTAEAMRPRDLKHSFDIIEGYVDWKFGAKSSEREGTPWRSPGLSKYMKGKRLSALTFWQGYNFAGKTTIMLQEMGDDCKHGVRCLFVSLEMSAIECLDFLLPQQIGSNEFSPKDVHDQCSKFLHNLWWVERRGQVDLQELKQTITCAVKSFGIEQVYVDNLTCIGMRKDDYNAQADFASMAKFQLAAELGIHMHVATHSRKAQNARHVSSDRNDMAGAKELGDLADEVLIMRRNENKDEEQARYEPSAQLDVDKNRFGKKQGIIKLKYNEHNNRFTEFQEHQGPIGNGF